MSCLYLALTVDVDMLYAAPWLGLMRLPFRWCLLAWCEVSCSWLLCCPGGCFFPALSWREILASYGDGCTLVLCVLLGAWWTSLQQIIGKRLWRVHSGADRGIFLLFCSLELSACWVVRNGRRLSSSELCCTEHLVTFFWNEKIALLRDSNMY